MADDDQISEAGRKARFERWEELGLDRVKADLLSGGHRLVGGPRTVRELAWEWVRMKEAEQQQTPAPAQQKAELLTLKPTLWGMGIDLKELWRRIRGFVIVAKGRGSASAIFNPRERQDRKRKWYSSEDIFKLADPNLMKDAIVAEEEIQQVVKRIREVQQEREALRIRPPFGSGPISIESEGLEVLRESAREASARNSALQEVREKARMRALQDIYEKLKTGKLVARGYVSPVDSNSKEVEIPAGHWKLIRFNSTYTEASNNDIKYVGIEVARS
jgi:hypothetical protein